MENISIFLTNNFQIHFHRDGVKLVFNTNIPKKKSHSEKI